MEENTLKIKFAFFAFSTLLFSLLFYFNEGTYFSLIKAALLSFFIVYILPVVFKFLNF